MISDVFNSLVMVSAMLAALMVFKHFLGKTMTASWKFRLGYLFFLILILPFIPCDGVKSAAAEAVAVWVPAGERLSRDVSDAAIVSFAQNKTVFFTGGRILAMWAVGALAVGSMFFVSSLRLMILRKRSSKAGEDTMRIFRSCLEELGMDGKIDLRIGKVNSPMVFGLFSACVIIPGEDIPKEDLRHIFMHELIHYKRGDVAVNYAVCLFEILYWFDPLVWLAFRGFRADMEAACDEAVMEQTGDGYGYGMTIIRFAGKRGYISAAEMGGTKKEVIKRVRAAAEFKRATAARKAVGALAFVLIAALAVSSLPAVSVNAFENYSPEQGKNIKEEDLSEYFDGIRGSFVLYDTAGDSYTVYNRELSEKRVSPDSTYKIFSAVSALENGVITAKNNTAEWDGTVYAFEEWMKDQDLDQAMKNSVNWYFDRLNSENMEGLRQTLEKVGYGNCDMSGGSDFWMEDSLKISPMEQTDILRSLYFNEYGFSDETVQTVKDAMELSDGFYGKTGSGMVNGKEVNGWFVGFVEKDGNQWFFALNLNDNDGANGLKAAETAVEILKDRGIIDHEI